MINRRKMIQGMAVGVGMSLLPSYAQVANKIVGGPKRIVFFLQNHGFAPLTLSMLFKFTPHLN